MLIKKKFIKINLKIINYLIIKAKKNNELKSFITFKIKGKIKY